LKYSFSQQSCCNTYSYVRFTVNEKGIDDIEEELKKKKTNSSKKSAKSEEAMEE
jgi:hypothetical protein